MQYLAGKSPEPLDVCQNIEFGLKAEYEANPALTDVVCMHALDNAKVAVKKKLGYAKNENVTDLEEAQGIIDWCVAIGVERINDDLTLKEYLKRIEKVKKSVRRHSVYGKRSYYEFIRKFIV